MKWLGLLLLAGMALGQSTANNTSACSANGNPTAGCNGVGSMPYLGNPSNAGLLTTTLDPLPTTVSSLDVHTMLYSGTTTRVAFLHVPYFCNTSSPNCNGHKVIGMQESNAAQILKQAQYMKSIGGDVVMEDFDGCGAACGQSSGHAYDLSISTALANAIAANPSTTPKLMIMLDAAAINGSGTGQCAPASGDVSACLIAAYNAQMDYVAKTWLYQSYYETNATNGHPIVVYFPNKGSWPDTNFSTVFAAVAAHATSGNSCGTSCTYSATVDFLDENAGGFTESGIAGAYGWPQPNTYSLANQFCWQGNPCGFNYLSDFYSHARANPSKIAMGVIYKGFDDHMASWGANRVISQQFGNVLGFTAGAISTAGYNSGSQLQYAVVSTWDDYEEGTEVETGVDNGITIGAPTISAGVLSWTLTKADPTYVTTNTISSFSIYTGITGPTNLYASGLSPATTSFAAPTPAPGQNVWVYMIGTPLIQNRLSAPLSNAPAQYSARTDLIPQPYPASIPCPGPSCGTFGTFTGANYQFTPSDFPSTPFLRVTDNSTTASNHQGFTANCDDGSEGNDFNTLSTRFVLCQHGNIQNIWSFNPATLQFAQITGPIWSLANSFTGGQAFYSYTQPYALYHSHPCQVGITGCTQHDLTIFQADTSGGGNPPTPSVVVDLNTACGLPNYAGPAFEDGVTVSRDDQTFSFNVCNSGSCGQGSAGNVITGVWNRTNGCSYLNTSTWQVFNNGVLLGTAGGTPQNFVMHNARITQDGSLLRINKGTCTSCVSGQNWLLWTPFTTSIAANTDLNGCGHLVNGYSHIANKCQGPKNINGMGNYPFSSLNIWTSLPAAYPTSSDANEAHLNWSNDNLTDTNPFFVSFDWTGSFAANFPWDSELVGVSTDGSGKVYRFAHNYATPTPSAFVPINASQDGKFLLLSTDWNQMLGCTNGTTLGCGPNQPSWVASHLYAAGALVTPLTGNAGGYSYQTTGGTSGSSQPSLWAQAIGGTSSDGVLTWTNVGVYRTDVFLLTLPTNQRQSVTGVMITPIMPLSLGQSSLYSLLLGSVLPNAGVTGAKPALRWNSIESNTTPGSYSWTTIDNELLTLVSTGKKIPLTIELANQSGAAHTATSGNNATPTYVFGTSWATTVGAPNPQDITVCANYPGDTASPYGQTGFVNGGVWNSSNPTWGSDLSGLPVSYELPIKVAAKNFLTQVVQHFSGACSQFSSDCANAAIIAASIPYMQMGFTAGAEDGPLCINYWPFPSGYTTFQGAYLDGSNSGGQTGYVDEMTAFMASTYATYHPSWTFIFDTHDMPTYGHTFADREAADAANAGFGFGFDGMQSSDLVNCPGPSCGSDWYTNFALYPNVPHYIQTFQASCPDNNCPTGNLIPLLSFAAAHGTNFFELYACDLMLAFTPASYPGTGAQACSPVFSTSLYSAGYAAAITQANGGIIPLPAAPSALSAIVQ